MSDDNNDGGSSSVGRRRFLQGTAAGAAGVAAVGAVLAGGARSDARGTGPVVSDAYPFEGAHQSGVLTPDPANKQASLMIAAFDVIAPDRAGLESLLRTVTERARFLTRGGTPADLGVGKPPADSAVLGPVVPADGLTVTLGVGDSLFDGRFGLAGVKPKRLTPMTTFPNDQPDPAQCHGDLVIALCANNPDTVHHALRDIAKHTRGAMQLRWKMQGYGAPPRPGGSPRNLLGFKDGTANPTGGQAESLIWVEGGGDEPAWTEGGTYLVVRLIRMLVEFWDRVSIAEQEGMFGRRRDSGAPLDGAEEFDEPDYSKDPEGDVIPVDSHIRLANPREGEKTEKQRLVRRSYNYDLGLDVNGNMACGHVFICFQRDIQAQFEEVQKRLIDEPLTDYVTPFGGGYFFAVPGVKDSSDFLGSGLFR
ncbi:Deferrochelatase OS=Tsukamurella paurometabola (strain ATCC 8368 / DSM / CCUG 35730 / CIP 100753/ JCM 10117 / KCTC 9821 / NBRC 16120 / NCIMB 702349 / NCTC 13040) OX=521096 GN=Tpau_3347 PE=3 SV=1 [Tsukamurella paurometabola]|uniref:Deferrochelatase n=1 Tax=Tsukamurella paurometabola (strain ATCC 8368 / DSM 20162 / CCUG 35730 / CIP 100753 / JCM 10117 / KCTC 9821 / NBRC 16120 / NCIMB 702349 / NCTC 13040) TaxID=521096 RepID=D5UWD2_TSUPD|nr:iron uptake transporter deferrochelatase/peroxidase subunit [Tsukamurella paurometabola]ADG79931.1 Dyp-type peroxidase family [Tsukamurella paurometabola DSM 20162]SUP37704.1 Deferrochelatase/peroxidase EfeB precursor [Tsukamurella paurometabola]